MEFRRPRRSRIPCGTLQPIQHNRCQSTHLDEKRQTYPTQLKTDMKLGARLLGSKPGMQCQAQSNRASTSH